MIKGISTESSDSSDFSYYISFNLSEGFSLQDTIKNSSSGSSSVLQVQKPEIRHSDTVSVDQQRLERLMKLAEEREKAIARPKAKVNKLTETSETAQTDSTVFIGSTSRIYSDFVPSFQKLPEYNSLNVNDNFLLNISEKTVDLHYKVKDTTKINTSTVSTAVVPKNEIPTGFEGQLRNYADNSWYVFGLLLALSIFAWGKSMYQKYLLQIINSVYNYQISIQLFRDRNALFRNLSIILQLLFPINIGLLIYFMIDYYQLQHISPSPLANIAIYSVGVFIFFRLKNLIYKFLGLVFKVQEEFNEVQHHMNVFNQTLGVALLPFVISMPFLNDNLKIVSLIGLLLLIGVFLLLFFFRGFQIVTRKQVPIFFLIMYLCAVEILPVVLLVKTSYAII